MNETKTKPVIETWPVKPEREAVRIWRETKRRQCRVYFLDDHGAFCALGVLDESDSPDFERFAIDIRSNAILNCPRCEQQKENGFHMVAHWNDDHRFTFKEIADLAEAYPHLVFKDVS